MRRKFSAMRMQFIMIAILAATWFLLTVEAAPLSFQNQLNVALQKIAELKGDAFDSCCNVSITIVSRARTHSQVGGAHAPHFMGSM
jgi:hypothetical protein